MPSLIGGVALLAVLYLGFGFGNGATFQLVPHRWKGRTGVMTGIIGAAGGIGGFYLPVIMGIGQATTAVISTGSLPLVYWPPSRSSWSSPYTSNGWPGPRVRLVEASAALSNDAPSS